MDVASSSLFYTHKLCMDFPPISLGLMGEKTVEIIIRIHYNYDVCSYIIHLKLRVTWISHYI